jgi:hypothetical protein
MMERIGGSRPEAVSEKALSTGRGRPIRSTEVALVVASNPVSAEAVRVLASTAAAATGVAAGALAAACISTARWMRPGSRRADSEIAVADQPAAYVDVLGSG